MYEDLLETTIRRELWMCAIIFLKYVRAKERKCKDGFPNKEPYRNCMLGLPEREGSRVQWYQTHTAWFQILTWPLTSYVTLRLLVNLPVPQFSH